MPRLNLNICLTSIPKDLIRYANGKAYINLNVSELRDIDERGNDHTISVYVPQERREEYPDKIYIGRGKLIPRYDDPTYQQAKASLRRNDDNDLPADNETGLPF